ncbi:hypothetical protein ACN26Y_03285 [Micromonospora sp. WMMD558]|uniref:hypothetical protein n=1 Tax=Micromonospora sp. WMMD558 TaxID=3403462 RepID=UPI003BF5842E
MATSEAGAGPRRRTPGGRRRAVLGWGGWAAAVAVLSMLGRWIGGAAEPEWAEEVALVLVIGLASVAAPPVLDRLSAGSPEPGERARDAARPAAASAGPPRP